MFIFSRWLNGTDPGARDASVAVAALDRCGGRVDSNRDTEKVQGPSDSQFLPDLTSGLCGEQESHVLLEVFQRPVIDISEFGVDDGCLSDMCWS